MEAAFWQRRWQKGEIAFHESATNPLLIKHFSVLHLTAGERVFVPLCGKTLDIAWLLSQGLRVVGVELIESAVEQLFAELNIIPTVTEKGVIKHYSTDNLDIFVGDIFLVSADLLGDVTAVYDRAALVALPEAMRLQYAAHLTRMTHKAPQLLITYEYDQTVMNGPPFSVSPEEVRQHYQPFYQITLLADANVTGGLKGRCSAMESVWLLNNS